MIINDWKSLILFSSMYIEDGNQSFRETKKYTENSTFTP